MPTINHSFWSENRPYLNSLRTLSISHYVFYKYSISSDKFVSRKDTVKFYYFEVYFELCLVNYFYTFHEPIRHYK